jgi:uncharacterized protein
VSAPSDLPWREASTGVVLRVRLTPKSYRDAIEGVEATADGPAIKARVRAVPEDCAANAALEKLVASWLDVPRRDVSLVSGGKSRVKSLAIAGDPSALAAALRKALALQIHSVP